MSSVSAASCGACCVSCARRSSRAVVSFWMPGTVGSCPRSLAPADASGGPTSSNCPGTVRDGPDLLAWAQQLLLTGDLAHAEPATLRYRLWHTAAKIARHARQTRLRLDRHWPWAGQLAAAFARLQALPAA